MGDPAAVATAISTVITEEAPEGAKSSSANRNGRKGESGFFTWFMVLALLGVWTSVAVVYFDLVDYQGVLGKLVAYDTDGDGDFDVEDAKVLLDEPGGSARRAAKDPHPTKDVGLKLRQALMQQLEVIHQRVEAKKLARLALAEVRQLLAKEEEEEQELDVGRKEISARVKERVAARLRAEEEKMEQEEMEKLRKEKAKEEEEKLKKEEEKLREEEKEEVEEEEGREPKPKRKKSKPERKDRI